MTEEATQRPFATGWRPFRPHCHQCSDGGKMLARRRDGSSLPYAFRCTCGAGDRTLVAFPPWTEDLAREFETIGTASI